MKPRDKRTAHIRNNRSCPHVHSNREKGIQIARKRWKRAHSKRNRVLDKIECEI